MAETIYWQFGDQVYKTEFMYRLTQSDKEIIFKELLKYNPKLGNWKWFPPRVAQCEFFVGKKGLYEMNYEFVKNGTRKYPTCSPLHIIYDIRAEQSMMILSKLMENLQSNLNPDKITKEED